MEDIKRMKIGDIVANDFRTSSIFKSCGIDFCCGGNQSLEQACTEKKLDISSIEEKIIEMSKTDVDYSHNFKEWNLDFLCDYIMNTHHKTVLKLLPELSIYTQKISDVHGSHHPELTEIANLFKEINIELLQHLKNEEEVLFPAIKTALKDSSHLAKQTILNEIKRMKAEHEFAGGAMDRINVLSSNYKLPEDACNTYKVAYKLLEQFEDDLHVHVHLENNILYPKALNIA